MTITLDLAPLQGTRCSFCNDHNLDLALHDLIRGGVCVEPSIASVRVAIPPLAQERDQHHYPPEQILGSRGWKAPLELVELEQREPPRGLGKDLYVKKMMAAAAQD